MQIHRFQSHALGVNGLDIGQHIGGVVGQGHLHQLLHHRVGHIVVGDGWSLIGPGLAVGMGLQQTRQNLFFKGIDQPTQPPLGIGGQSPRHRGHGNHTIGPTLGVPQAGGMGGEAAPAHVQANLMRMNTYTSVPDSGVNKWSICQLSL